jgi:hypothetical protein
MSSWTQASRTDSQPPATSSSRCWASVTFPRSSRFHLVELTLRPRRQQRRRDCGVVAAVPVDLALDGLQRSGADLGRFGLAS